VEQPDGRACLSGRLLPYLRQALPQGRCALQLQSERRARGLRRRRSPPNSPSRPASAATGLPAATSWPTCCCGT
jgi:hypothetical protein